MVQAAWRKYPNPMNPAVLGTDVIDRKVVDGVLHTHRLVTSEWGLPGWARSVRYRSINFSDVKCLVTKIIFNLSDCRTQWYLLRE